MTQISVKVWHLELSVCWLYYYTPRQPSVKKTQLSAWIWHQCTKTRPTHFLQSFPPQKLLPYLSSLLKILCKTSKSWGFSPSNETVSLTSATIYCHGIYFLFFLLGLKYLNSPGNLMLSQYTRLIQLLPVIMVTVTTHHITNTSPSLSITSSY